MVSEIAGAAISRGHPAALPPEVLALKAHLRSLYPDARFQVDSYLATELPADFAHALVLLAPVVDGTGARFKRMAASNCHANARALADAHAGWSVWTGLALSGCDPCWRVHSYCTNSRGRIVETTVPRVAYWGLAMVNIAAGVPPLSARVLHRPARGPWA